MVEFNESQIHELRELGKKLGVSSGAIEASALVVTSAVSCSESKRIIREGESPPASTVGVVDIKPLTSTVRTRSIKWRNLFHTDMRTLLEIAAGGVLTGADIAALPHPILIAAGLLIMISSFTRAFQIEFSEREASVFWGLIRACGRKKLAHFDAIVDKTTEVRCEAGLDPLSRVQVEAALKLLQSTESIRRVSKKPAVWRIRERWKTEQYSGNVDRHPRFRARHDIG